MLKLVNYDECYLQKSLGWLNDQEIQLLIDSNAVINRESQKRWYDAISADSTYQIWGVEYDGMPIGACGIKHINYADKVGEYWGYIGEKKYWGGKGHALLEHIYKKAHGLGIELLTLCVLKSNARAVSLYKSEGFVVDSETEERLFMKKRL